MYDTVFYALEALGTGFTPLPLTAMLEVAGGFGELELQCGALQTLDSVQQFVRRAAPHHDYLAALIKKSYRATFMGTVGENVGLQASSLVYGHIYPC